MKEWKTKGAIKKRKEEQQLRENKITSERMEKRGRY